MQVAVLTTVLPEGCRTGGEIVSQTLVEALRAAGHHVDVVGYQRPDAPPATDAGAVSAGTRAIETGRAGRGQVARWMADAVRRRLPYSVAKYRSGAYLAAARTAVAGADVVLVDHAQAGWVLDELALVVPVVLVAHNVEHELYAEQRASGALPRRLVYGREERRMRALERRLAAGAAQVWVLTEADAAAFARLAPPGVVRRFGVPGQAPATAEAARTTDVAIIGTWTWAANAAGLRWFCDEVRPRLAPGCTVDVAGVGAEWCASVPGIRYLGRVPDAADFLAGARVVAIPSVAGSGVQVKTLDALAAGTWIVATPVAVRGIDGTGDAAVVTDDPANFAAALERLVADDRTLGPNRAALDWAGPRAERFRTEVASAVAELA